MPATSVTIPTRDGACPAAVFRPDGVAEPRPAVLFFMDALGVRPAMNELCERIASWGYVVLYPDLFYRVGPYEPADPKQLFGDAAYRQAWFGKYVAAANQANVRSDAAAWLDWLAAQPFVKAPKVGTVGYCMGGGLALGTAGNYPDRIAAAASYHGGRLATDAPDSPHLVAKTTKARVYVAGAENDTSFPDDMKERLAAAYRDAGVDATIETYAGGRHGFVPRDMPVYDAALAQRHDETLRALFARALG
jgi:carboxymethylenebutenolidase